RSRTENEYLATDGERTERSRGQHICRDKFLGAFDVAATGNERVFQRPQSARHSAGLRSASIHPVLEIRYGGVCHRPIRTVERARRFVSFEDVPRPIW